VALTAVGFLSDTSEAIVTGDPRPAFASSSKI
jgi:hypothetical protein